jgi:hypothetical protein
VGGLCQQIDIKEVLELSAAIDDAIALARPDQSAVEAWLRAFLEAGIPSQLVNLAVSIIRTGFRVSSPDVAAATAHGHPLLQAWAAAQSLLFQFSAELATKPSLPKELARGFLDCLLPTNHGGASECPFLVTCCGCLFGPICIGSQPMHSL